MKSDLIPPGRTETVHAESALVVAPHFDDEVLGCGGLVAQLTAAGAAVYVLFLSDGGGGTEDVDDRGAYRTRRREEADRAAEVLGLAGVDRLDLPDGALDQHLDAMREGVARALLSQRPDILLATSPLEASLDHRAAFRAVHEALAGLAGDDILGTDVLAGLTVLAYEVNHPLYPNLLVDVSAELATLEAAMACYASQEERHDYLAACLGLRRYRAHSLPSGLDAVEAYRRLVPDDFTTRSPAGLITELGGAPQRLEVSEGPRISVVVRTRDRPELLAEALASLARSTWRRADVVVVNDGGAPPELPADFALPLTRIDLETNRGRAAAANAGVAAAAGDWVTFLDDDDLAEPEHLATLAGLAAGAGVRVAYTDAAVGVYELGGDGPGSGGGVEGWHCVERRRPYSRDFDPDLLLFDNYIPFNTLLVERRLFDEAGELDTGLPFFEDWDFLIRLAARTRFHHLPRVTCEYRHFRGAGHHILGEDPRRRDDFLVMKARVLAKHAGLRTPEITARIVDRLRAEAVAELEAKGKLRRELAAAEERFHDLNGRFTASETRQKTLEEWRDRVLSELGEEHVEHRRLDREVERLYGREHELEREVERAGDRERELRATGRELHEEVERLQDRERGLVAELEAQSAESAHWMREWEERAGVLERQARETGERLEAALAQAHAEHGDTAERLRLMTEQEGRVADELRRTYAEIERLNGVVGELAQRIRDMESTRAWRLHTWWQERKPGRGGRR